MLRRLFKPRSIALVGASARSIWSNSAMDNIVRFGFDGPVHLVNPKGGEIYGKAAATSCAAIGEEIDAALLMVPEAALLGAIEDLAAARVGGAVLLTAGFAELGEAGAVRQREIAVAAEAAGIALLGPNCLGYVNFADKIPLWTNQARRPMAEQTVAVVSQSGATAGQMAQFAYQQRIGLSHMISTGNESGVDIADAIGFLADEPEVKSIALFLETVRRPAAFLEAVGRAQQAGKPVVLLKVGASEAAAKAAEAHTGSIVGDDRVFSAVCRQFGLLRVHSLEDLICTADLLGRVGRVDAEGLALVGMSGGMCEIAIDQGDRDGVPFAKLRPETMERLSDVLPSLATANNPLDITGAAMLDPPLISAALGAIGQDEGVGLVSYIFDAPASLKAGEGARPFLKAIGEGFRAGGKPAIMLSHAFTPVTGDADTMAREYGITYCGAGLTHGMTALGHLFAWSGRTALPLRTDGMVARPPSSARPKGEREVLGYLEAAGVPVVPSRLTRSPDEAVAAMEAWGEPIVLKVASADIPHKTEAGGVLLDLRSSESVREGWAAISDNVGRARPDAVIDGILAAPMRSKGTEIFVGTMRDPQWGPVIAVGLGGIFVEALKDTSLRLLPITAETAETMLGELRGAALLDGFRGMPAVDRKALTEVIVKIGNAALDLDDALVSLEINPLLAVGDRIEALDGLAVWADGAGEEAE